MTTGDLCLTLDDDIYQQIKALALASHTPLVILLEAMLEGYQHIRQCEEHEESYGTRQSH